MYENFTSRNTDFLRFNPHHSSVLFMILFILSCVLSEIWLRKNCQQVIFGRSGKASSRSSSMHQLRIKMSLPEDANSSQTVLSIPKNTGTNSR